MANLNNFDASQVDPSVALDPLPAGKYVAVISESELKPTKTGVGKYLQLTFQIMTINAWNRLGAAFRFAPPIPKRATAVKAA